MRFRRVAYTKIDLTQAVHVAVVVPTTDEMKMTKKNWAELVLLALTLLGLYAGE